MNSTSSDHLPKLANYIGGEWVAPVHGRYLQNINPSTGQVFAEVPDSSEEDVICAISKAEEAFPRWSALSLEARSRILRKMGDCLEARFEEFAQLESQDNGKPLRVAQTVDIPRSIKNFRFFADSITQFHGESFQEEEGVLHYTSYTPLGVVSCISPWNLPLYLFTWKVAPALAAGNTVVAKPSEITPMTAALFAEVCEEAGLPPGVLNIVHGRGDQLGPTLSTHPSIKAVSFTGSSATGEIIAAQTAPLFKKISLELGGKNPNIIFADGDFEKAIQGTLRSSFANQGQICLCGSRIFVEKSIYEEFRDRLIKETKKLVVGPPSNKDTDQGAVVSQDHHKKILSCIELAKAEGGKILTGGGAATPKGFEEGYYIQPTLIEGLGSDCRTNQEEIFGPVATIMPFESEAEVISWANGTKYGLSATIWTENLKRAHRVAGRLEAGMVWINGWSDRDLRTPFGGVKSSGVGREGGFHVLKFFSEVKSVGLRF